MGEAPDKFMVNFFPNLKVGKSLGKNEMTNAQPEPSMEEILASIRRIISEDEEQRPSIERSALDTETVNTQTQRDVSKPSEKPSLDVVQPSEASVDTSDEESPLTRIIEAEERLSHNVEANTQANSEVSTLTEDLSQTPDQPVDDDTAKAELQTEDVKMVKQQAAAVEVVEETIVDNVTAKATTEAFGALARTVRVADDQGQTLETLVTDMLRPMVKDWLDNNLSRIVEEKVEYEVQRLSRRS